LRFERGFGDKIVVAEMFVAGGRSASDERNSWIGAVTLRNSEGGGTSIGDW